MNMGQGFQLWLKRFAPVGVLPLDAPALFLRRGN
jgi:hypothetical protein